MSAKLFHSNIKILRQQSKLSQSGISDKIEVEAKRYAKWEEGRAQPDIDNIIAIAEAYGISLDKLLRIDLKTKNSKSLNQILINKIIYEICEYFGYSINELKTKHRGVSELCECRQLIYYFLFAYKVATVSQIGRELKRNHESVIHGVQVVKDLLTIDPIFRNNFTNLERIVKEILETTIEK